MINFDFDKTVSELNGKDKFTFDDGVLVFEVIASEFDSSFHNISFKVFTTFKSFSWFEVLEITRSIKFTSH